MVNLIIVMIILACILVVVLAVIEADEVNVIIDNALGEKPVIETAVLVRKELSFECRQKYTGLLQNQKTKLHKLMQWYADELMDEQLYQSQLKEIKEDIDKLESEIKAL